jgi:hypothetical protein
LGMSVIDPLPAWVLAANRSLFGAILARAMCGHRLSCRTSLAVLSRGVAILFRFRLRSVRVIPVVTRRITLRLAGKRLAGCLSFGRPLCWWTGRLTRKAQSKR